MNTPSKLLCLAAIATTIPVAGCNEKPPAIKNCHWNGDYLYNAQGEEVASVITIPFDHTLVCDRLTHIECKFFETRQQGFDWLAKMEEEQP